MPRVDPSDPRRRYQQIADRLRTAIDAGEFPPGSFLPSQVELSRQEGVSLFTARAALRTLAAEGRVEARGTRGFQVKQRPRVRHWVADFVGGRTHAEWFAKLEAEGKAPVEELRRVGRVLASADVAGRLNLDEEAQVVVRERLVRVDGEPYELATSYYPLAIAQGTRLEEPLRIKGGASQVLGDLGWTPRLYHDEVIIDLAPASEVRSALELGTVIPAIRVWRTVYASRADGEAVPVDLTEILLAGDRHILDYHVAVAGPQAALGTDG